MGSRRLHIAEGMDRTADWTHRAERGIARQTREHKHLIQWAARIGWATKGALYITLGILAVMAATGEGGRVEGGRGVVQWVASQPFGQFLLGVAGVGFACYALWRALQAIVDPEPHDDHKEMIAKRVGWGLSAAVHASLSVLAFQILAGSGSSGGQKGWIAQALANPGGPFLIGALGVFVIGVGLYQFKKAAKLGFMNDVQTAQMSQTERKSLRIVGRVGHAARGVVFPIIGYFLVKAAVTANPGQAKGVEGALEQVASTGWYWLAILAIGLAAYGMLQLFYAKYRRIRLT